MNLSQQYSGLHFDELRVNRRRFRLIFTVTGLAIFTLLWVLIPSGGLYWLLLMPMTGLLWLATYAWLPALHATDGQIHTWIAQAEAAEKQKGGIPVASLTDNLTTHQPIDQVTVSKLTATDLLRFGTQMGWQPQDYGVGPLPDAPTLVQNRRLVPLAQEQDPIPAWVNDRLQTVDTAGFQLVGAVIVHDPEKAVIPAILPQEALETLKVVGAFLGAMFFGVMLLAGLVVIALATISMLALAASVLMGAALIDPHLVLLLYENETDPAPHWIKIADWKA